MSSLSVSEAEKKTDVKARCPSPAVKVQDVSITYRTTFERVPTFKSAIVRFGRGERAVREVKAVQNVCFDVDARQPRSASSAPTAPASRR